MDGGPGLWVVFALAIVASAFVQSSIGFGFALVAMSILPFFLGIRSANLIVSLSALVPLVLSAWAYRRGVDWAAVGACAVGAVLMLPLGISVFVLVSPDWLTRGTGCVVLLLALDGLIRSDVEPRPLSRRWLWSAAAGAVSGFLSGAISIGGPPVALFGARQAWTPPQFKAFIVNYLLIITSLKSVGLCATGLVTQPVIWYSLAAVPFGFLGGRLGVWATAKIDARRFRRLVLSVLAVIALSMIVRGAGE